MFRIRALSTDRAVRVGEGWRSIGRFARPQPGSPRVIVFSVVAVVVLVHVAFPGVSPAEDEGVPVLTGTPAAAAIVVETSPRCAAPPAALPQLLILWVIDDTRLDNPTMAANLAASTDFRVDVTMYRDGFKDGRFESHTKAATTKPGFPSPDRPQGPGHSMTVPNLRAAVNYTTRLLILTPDGWMASEELEFFTPICPVDGIE